MKLPKAGRGRAGAGALLLVALRPDADEPLYRQVYAGLRQAILNGRLRPGGRLPSTRSLAADLHVSRSTAVQAYEQLRAEGYIDSVGRGATRVSSSLPEPQTRADPGKAAAGQRAIRHPSRRGEAIARASGRFPNVSDRPARAFRTSVPALDVFPVDVWGRLTSRRWRRSSPGSLGYGDPRGLPALRRAIADYLTGARGVRCIARPDPRDLGVTAGARSRGEGAPRPGRPRVAGGSRLFRRPRRLRRRGGADRPGAGGRRRPRRGRRDSSRAGRPSRLRHARAPDPARSHHESAPVASPCSPGRPETRLASSRTTTTASSATPRAPCPSLQGLDAGGCVVFTGTFSKVLLPALRLGYLVVPESLVDAFAAARRLLDLCPPHLDPGGDGRLHRRRALRAPHPADARDLSGTARAAGPAAHGGGWRDWSRSMLRTRA